MRKEKSQREGLKLQYYSFTANTEALMKGVSAPETRGFFFFFFPIICNEDWQDSHLDLVFILSKSLINKSNWKGKKPICFGG